MCHASSAVEELANSVTDEDSLALMDDTYGTDLYPAVVQMAADGTDFSDVDEENILDTIEDYQDTYCQEGAACGTTTDTYLYEDYNAGLSYDNPDMATTGATLTESLCTDNLGGTCTGAAN